MTFKFGSSLVTKTTLQSRISPLCSEKSLVGIKSSNWDSSGLKVLSITLHSRDLILLIFFYFSNGKNKTYTLRNPFLTHRYTPQCSSTTCSPIIMKKTSWKKNMSKILENIPSLSSRLKHCWKPSHLCNRVLEVKFEQNRGST